MPSPRRPLWWTKPFYETPQSLHAEDKPLADLEEPERPKIDIMELIRQASKQ